MVPIALSKLQNKGGDPKNVTKKEIIAIFFSVLHTLKEEKNKKEILAGILLKLVENEPPKLHFLV
jgi:hypothetical protein